ncbi:hypothetical protein [Piscinibacter gummiphilus]|uniref:Uncharacterized protein n=1 Tax=Piscinibacter gummiphilus TaxID=946333 RepID=A0ABZ0D3I0_9BURK|nr:hypothetical protein [Piscinibacter gummiphilus]WOB11346.1 hypothetical protein RXV79_28100 [Piscinibacter gummiphilus]
MTDRLSDVAHAFTSSLTSLLATWTSAERLYTLEGDGELRDLMVERFSLIEAISNPYRLQLHTLCLHNRVRLQGLLGQRVTLCTVLADGSKHRRSGLVRIPLMADSDSIPIADSVPGDGGHAARVS